MTTTPPPRPALRRADDGTVHPAAAHLSSLAVDVSSTSARERRRKAKKKDRDKSEETVDITVTVPKQVRKRLRRKAETYGWTAEEAASHVLRVWADD
jgi:ribosome-binding protein aMBF1 (putative translation factor)